MAEIQESKFKNERFFGRKTEIALAWEYIRV